MDNLITRLRSMGLVLIIPILVVIIVALGALYMQQKGREGALQEQINKLQLTLLKPVASTAELEEDYRAVNSSLSPLTDKAALDIIIGIARESGIDVNPESGKLVIPPQNVLREENVGGGTYHVMSFKNMTVRGDYENVIAFILNLESGEALKTMVLRGVSIQQYEQEDETIATIDIDIYTKGEGG